MKISLTLCALACLLLSSCTVAKRVRVYDRRHLDSVASIPVDVDYYDKKYSEHDGIYLLSERYYEHSGGTKLDEIFFSKVHTHRYLVLNPHADNLTTFSLDVEKAHMLEGVGIIVDAPDGTRQFFGREQLKETRSESGTTSYKLALPNVRKGTVVTMMHSVVTLAIGPTLQDEVGLQYALPCERLEFHYAYPKWWRVQVKRIKPGTSASSLYAMNLDVERNKSIISYTADSVPAYRDELYSPYYKESSPYINYMLTFAAGGSIYLNPSSWDEVTKSLKQYASNEGRFWNRGAAPHADSVIARCTTMREKIDTITAYIHKNFTWVGRSDDMNAYEMFQKKEGNALTLSALARAMMERAGIETELLLIHSADDGVFDPDFFTPSQIYTPAVLATIDSTEYVILPYFKGLPPGILPDRLQGQDAIRLHKDGYNGFMKTPTGSPETNKRHDSYAITIDDEGTLKVEQDIELFGEMAYLKRRELEDLDYHQLKSEMKALLDYTDGDILNFTYDIVDRDDYGVPLKIKLRYTIDNLVTVTPEEVVFQTGGLFSPASRNKNKVDVDERVSPIRVYSDEELDKKISIRFPASWKLATSLPNVEKSSTFGEVMGSYSVTSGALDVTHQRVLRRGASGPEKFSELLAIIGSRSVLNVPSLVFKRDAAGN